MGLCDPCAALHSSTQPRWKHGMAHAMAALAGRAPHILALARCWTCTGKRHKPSGMFLHVLNYARITVLLSVRSPERRQRSECCLLCAFSRMKIAWCASLSLSLSLSLSVRAPQNEDDAVNVAFYARSAE